MHRARNRASGRRRVALGGDPSANCTGAVRRHWSARTKKPELVFDGNRIEAAPEIPGCDRAPRPPKIGDGKHGLARQPLAVVEMNRYRALQPDIVDR